MAGRIQVEIQLQYPSSILEVLDGESYRKGSQYLVVVMLAQFTLTATALV